jgi:hypothetical protein
MVGSFLQSKVHQIIAIIDCVGSNTTASDMPILIWIPTISDNRRMCTVNWKEKLDPPYFLRKFFLPKLSVVVFAAFVIGQFQIRQVLIVGWGKESIDFETSG